MAHRVALGLTATMAATVLIMLPFAMRSMVAVLTGAQHGPLYDLLANGEVTPVDRDTEATETGRSYFNIAVVGIDEAAGSATFAVSGNRQCPGECPAVALTLLSLDDNASLRRGLPPSATVDLSPAELVFSESVTLPVRGRPALYPFDTYELWLGFAVALTTPEGTPIRPNLEDLAQRVTFTLQSQVPDLVMDPPRPVHPDRAMSETDPFALPLVEELRLERPLYLKILASLLVLLIAASGIIALLTRSIDDLLLGIGGLILGVWGIRSVLVTQPLAGVSAVDLALSLVILFLLLGLMARLVRHFHQRSELHWRRFRVTVGPKRARAVPAAPAPKPPDPGRP